MQFNYLVPFFLEDKRSQGVKTTTKQKRRKKHVIIKRAELYHERKKTFQIGLSCNLLLDGEQHLNQDSS